MPSFNRQGGPGRRRRRRPSLPPLLLGLALFGCGFFLGRAARAQEPTPADGGTAVSSSADGAAEPDR